MTEKQLRWFNTALWPRACRAQGWAVADREFKLAAVSRIIGRDITTTKDVHPVREFDLLKTELEHLANPDNLDAALKAVERGGEDQRRRWLHKLQTEFRENYVKAVVESFSKGQTSAAADLPDHLLKAVVVTCEQRARIKPSIRKTVNNTAAESPVTDHPSSPDFVPFDNQF